MKRPTSTTLRICLTATVVATLTACASCLPSQPASSVIELPLVSGWYDGEPVYYVTTDISDQDMARAKGANFVPKLANAIPPEPHAPGQATALERIYVTTNFKQGSVLPSLPKPTGAGNADTAYSPLWQVHKITWLDGKTPHLLRSEEEVLEAQDKGEISISKTNIVVNCPVISSSEGGLLPNARVRIAP